MTEEAKWKTGLRKRGEKESWRKVGMRTEKPWEVQVRKLALSHLFEEGQVKAV